MPVRSRAALAAVTGSQVAPSLLYEAVTELPSVLDIRSHTVSEKAAPRLAQFVSDRRAVDLLGELDDVGCLAARRPTWMRPE